jgi:hypothetical protein
MVDTTSSIVSTFAIQHDKLITTGHLLMAPSTLCVISGWFLVRLVHDFISTGYDDRPRLSITIQYFQEICFWGQGFRIFWIFLAPRFVRMRQCRPDNSLWWVFREAVTGKTSTTDYRLFQSRRNWNECQFWCQQYSTWLWWQHQCV